jgi:hypothetical protein
MLNIPRTKNEESNHVPLNDAALAALRAVHQRGEARERVFQSARTGAPLENGRHWFEDAVWQTGLPGTFVGTTCGIPCESAAAERGLRSKTLLIFSGIRV